MFSNEPVSNFALSYIVVNTKGNHTPHKPVNINDPLSEAKSLSGGGADLEKALNDVINDSAKSEEAKLSKIYVLSDLENPTGEIKKLISGANLKVEFIAPSTTTPETISLWKKALGNTAPVVQLKSEKVVNKLKI